MFCFMNIRYLVLFIVISILSDASVMERRCLRNFWFAVRWQVG